MEKSPPTNIQNAAPNRKVTLHLDGNFSAENSIEFIRVETFAKTAEVKKIEEPALSSQWPSQKGNNFSNCTNDNVQVYVLDQTEFASLPLEYLEHPEEFAIDKEDVERVVITQNQVHTFNEPDPSLESDSDPVCRTCLQSVPATLCNKLFDSVNSTLLREKLFYVVGEIDLNVSFDPVICSKCQTLLDIAFAFKKQVDATQKSLRKRLKKGKVNVNLRDLMGKSVEEDRTGVEGGIKEKRRKMFDRTDSLLYAVEKCDNNHEEVADEGENEGGLNSRGNSPDTNDERSNKVDGSKEDPRVRPAEAEKRFVFPFEFKTRKPKMPLEKDPSGEVFEVVKSEQTIRKGSDSEEEFPQLSDDEESGEQAPCPPHELFDNMFKTSDSAPVKRKKPMVPKSFDLFDEEHDKYFAHLQGEAGSRMVRKWSRFRRRAPQLGVGPYLCHECGIFATTRWKLKLHSYQHGSLLPFMCSYCGRLFKLVGNLKAHIKCKHTPPAHQCSICKKKFHMTLTYKAHLKVHEDAADRVLCLVCGAAIQARNLKRHTEKHKAKTYPCEVCGKVLKSHSSWKTHTFDHDPDRKYQCPRCLAFFSSGCSLSNHLRRVHMDEAKWKCDICKEPLCNKLSLLRHVQDVHATGKPELKRRKQAIPKETEEIKPIEGPEVIKDIVDEVIDYTSEIEEARQGLYFEEFGDLLERTDLCLDSILDGENFEI